MAGRQPIRVAQFAEAFKASWMIPRGATHLGRRQRGNDPLDLPWRIGKTNFITNSTGEIGAPNA